MSLRKPDPVEVTPFRNQARLRVSTFLHIPAAVNSVSSASAGDQQETEAAHSQPGLLGRKSTGRANRLLAPGNRLGLTSRPLLAIAILVVRPDLDIPAASHRTAGCQSIQAPRSTAGGPRHARHPPGACMPQSVPHNQPQPCAPAGAGRPLDSTAKARAGSNATLRCTAAMCTGMAVDARRQAAQA